MVVRPRTHRMDPLPIRHKPSRPPSDHSTKILRSRDAVHRQGGAMKNSTRTALLLSVFFSFAATVHAQVPLKTAGGEHPAVAISSESASYQLLNINNFTVWGRNNGAFGASPVSYGFGNTFPRGTASFLYSDECVWGGKMFLDPARTIPAHKQLIRIGGGSYREATIPGRINGAGASAIPADTNGADVRYYRIRRDYSRMTQDELRQDAAESNSVTEDIVTQAQIDAIRSQYDKDWKEWPVAQGAPYIERNGVPGYQAPPAFSATFTADSLLSGKYDEPGIAGTSAAAPADQVMWCVFNDLDPVRTLNIFRCEPIGLELQMTLWGYKRIGALGNTIFRRMRMINKGGIDTSAAGSGAKGAFSVDSMYVGVHADVDIGNAGDDLAGCDSAQNLSYFYNGNASDFTYSKFNLPPPSIGYELLQGPRVVSSTDTALYDMRKMPGWKNLRMSSAMKWATGDPYSEPVGSTYSQVVGQWWKALRGFLPLDSLGATDRLWPNGPYSPSKFPLSGDPVNGSGWIDGLGQQYSFVLGDQRAVPAVGPFSLAPSDTQEVVTSIIGGLGADRLSSISVMKTAARTAKAMHQSLYSIATPPSFLTDVSYPDSASAMVKIRADGSVSNLKDVRVSLRLPGGRVVAMMQLFDDGTHGDGVANDGIFGNSLTIARQDSGLSLSASVQDAYQNSFTIDNAVNFVTTAGPLQFFGPTIFSDNLNGDRIANPGENIRFGFSLRNDTRLQIGTLRIASATDDQAGKTITLGNIMPGLGALLSPDIGYFSVSIPAGYRDSVFAVPLVAFDRMSNRWNLTANFRVVQLKNPFQYSSLTHTTGLADGNFSIRIIDAQAVRNHIYVIQGSGDLDELGNPGIVLKDSSDGRILFTARSLPDPLGHDSPATDGFKILRGTVPDPANIGLKSWSVPSGQLRWSWINGSNYFYNLTSTVEFFGSIAWDEPALHSGYVIRKTLKPSAIRSVLIKFAATNTTGAVLDQSDQNWSFGYRYLRNSLLAAAKPAFAPFIKNQGSGYVFEEFTKNVPFSAWDVDTNPPRRLASGFLENNAASGRVDGKYWPPASTDTVDNIVATGPREWFFIFDVTYSETADSRLTKDLAQNAMPVMWWGTSTRNGNTAFQSGDQFLIQAMHSITSADRWVFNPTILAGIPVNGVPLEFDLSQNYPNPFNPSTTIEYTLPSTTNVTLRVYNLLGQEVTLLVDGKLNAGKHRLTWDGRNTQGMSVSTGVYLYRLVAGSRVETRKMLLLK